MQFDWSFISTVALAPVAGGLLFTIAKFPAEVREIAKPSFP
jgi:hypothetical protein